MLDDLRSLSKCAARASYEYSPEDAEKNFSAIERELQSVRDVFSGKRRFVLNNHLVESASSEMSKDTPIAKNATATATSGVKREWLLALDLTDRDCIHQYEYLLGRKLRDYDEYLEIDSHVDEMILEWPSRKDFFNAYPELERYRKAEPAAAVGFEEKLQSALDRAAGDSVGEASPVVLHPHTK